MQSVAHVSAEIDILARIFFWPANGTEPGSRAVLKQAGDREAADQMATWQRERGKVRHLPWWCMLSPLKNIEFSAAKGLI
jgi:hypothetical protein